MRDNETTRVAAVLAHLRDGDRRAAIDALLQLWLAEPERPDQIDGAAIDAWQAIVEAEAVDDALAAGLAIVREGKRLRRHAYLELTERVAEPVLIELAELALAQRWSADPYLAAVLVRLGERDAATAFFALIERHRARFESERELWELALFVMSTSRIGNRTTMARWFEGWVERSPRMWVVAAYAATLFEGARLADLTRVNLIRLVEISTLACAHLAWDDSAPALACFAMIGQLHRGEIEAFQAALDEHRDRIASVISTPRSHHPIVRFASSLKRAHPVIAAQLEHPRSHSLVNRQLSYVVADLSEATESMREALELYARLLALPRGASRAKLLHRRMAKLDAEGAGGWIRTAWHALLRQRTTWLQRALW